MTCILCKIAAGEIPAEKFYEDDKYLAFLDIAPCTEGQALIIPKKHFEDYLFDLPDEEYAGILMVAKKLVKHLDKALNTTRTFLMIEGLDVKHVHAKLFPYYVDRPFSFRGGTNASPEELKRVGDKVRKTVF